jgi:hypothetical protein
MATGADGGWAYSARGSDARMRLHVLDACLFELEEANERGERQVSPAVATRLKTHVPWLLPGMLLSEAIDGVFHDQARHLHTDVADPDSWSRDAEADGVMGPARSEPACLEPISAGQARTLTEQIKVEMHRVCVLLLEAHDRRAWKVLGYSTWESYVRSEFGLSRSRSYELLDQGRVLNRIQAAMGVVELPEISAYAAGEIKSRLPDVLDEIRRRTIGETSPDRVRQIVSEVVRTTREQVAATRIYPGRGPRSSPTESWLRELEDAVGFLASLPPPAYAIEHLSGVDVDRFAQLNRAVQWLTDFAAGLRGDLPNLNAASQDWRVGVSSQAKTVHGETRLASGV